MSLSPSLTPAVGPTNSIDIGGIFGGAAAGVCIVLCALVTFLVLKRQKDDSQLFQASIQETVELNEASVCGVNCPASPCMLALIYRELKRLGD